MGRIENLGWDKVLVGLTEAAKLTGKDNSTITRAALKGKLAFSLDANGNRMFDVVELRRWNRVPLIESEPKEKAWPDSRPTAEERAKVLERQLEEERAKGRIRELELKLELLEMRLANVEREKNEWREKAGTVARSIENRQREKATGTDPANAPDEARDQ